jgi:hypothetical protein
MKTRKMATFNTYAITGASLKKPNSVSFEISCLSAMSVDSMMFYIPDGSSDLGRHLRLVFQDKGKGLVRIFTGWELKREKKSKR